MAKVLRISRKELQKRLEISGLHVLSEALTQMESELLNAFPSYESTDHFIQQFTRILVINHKMDGFLVDSKIAQQVLQELRESRITRTVDNELVVKNVISSGHLKTNKNYLQHLLQLWKHLEKHPIFETKNFKLTKIDSLITSTDDSIDCIVFGFLFKDSQKIYDFQIEDNSGRVPLVFTEDTQFRDALIVENSYVLIEGTYSSQKDQLTVHGIGLPPPVDLNSTLEVSNGLQRMGRMVVAIADIHLDDSNTLDKMQTLFTGYESLVPIPDCFVFVGDFVSKQCEDVSDFKAHMKNFVKLIARFPKISGFSQLIFVPGFGDTGGDDIPKPQFGVDMFPHSTTKLKNYSLATNPVNLYIDGRHMCLSAFPYISKLRKHIIHNSTEDKTEMGPSLAKLIACNAHLTPGLDKSFESCLSTFHLPDFMLFRDNQMVEGVDGNAFDYISVANLPSFSRHDFKFKVFYTNPKLVESSQILV